MNIQRVVHLGYSRNCAPGARDDANEFCHVARTMADTERRRGLIGTWLARSAALSQGEIEAICHWVKQLIAFAYGLVCGVLPITGGGAIVSFFLITIFVTRSTIRFLSRGDPDRFDLEAHIELLKEGAMPAIGTFLLTWTLVFTLSYA